MFSNKIQIREMKLADISILVEIAKQTKLTSWGKAALKDCFKPDYLGWMIEFDDSPVGFVIIRMQLDEAELMVIAISPSHQGKKLGKQLLGYVIERLQSKKISNIYLEVRQSNQAAIKLYQSLGFMQVGLRKNYYPLELSRMEDAILMIKKLGSVYNPLD